MSAIENWLSIKNYEELYLVSSLGRIKALPRYSRCRGGWVRLSKERILKGLRHRSGYLYVELHGIGGIKSFYVHRLVASTFIGDRPEDYECRHLNGIKTDNRLENLCWGTRKQNGEDRVRHGHSCKGERNNAKVTEEDVLNIRKLYKEGVSQIRLAKRYGLSQPAISYIVCRKLWQHI